MYLYRSHPTIGQPNPHSEKCDNFHTDMDWDNQVERDGMVIQLIHKNDKKNQKNVCDDCNKSFSEFRF